MKQPSTTGIELRRSSRPASRRASRFTYSFVRTLVRVSALTAVLTAAFVISASFPAPAQRAAHFSASRPVSYPYQSGFQHRAAPPPPQHVQSHVVPAHPVATPHNPPSTQTGAATQPAQPNHAPVVRNQPSTGGAPTNTPAFRAPAYGPNAHPNGAAAPSAGIRPGHLGDWMQNHQNLSPSEQQHALEHEPGFNNLPPEQQARLRTRLQQLNTMSPDERQRTLNRIERMEQLSPQQRQQVTSTMGQFHALPRDQQRSVAQAFRQIRQLPPAERSAAAQNYDRQLNPQQRDTLNNLLRAEPYLPIQHGAAAGAAPTPAP